MKYNEEKEFMIFLQAEVVPVAEGACEETLSIREEIFLRILQSLYYFVLYVTENFDIANLVSYFYMIKEIFKI